MKHARPICFLLAVLMLSSSFLPGCSGGEEKDPPAADAAPATDTAPVTNAPETAPPDPAAVHDLPADLDFDGADFVMYSQTGSCILFDEPDAEILNQTKYEMKTYVEELLNVSLGERLGTTLDPLTYYLSGETEIQMINELDRFAFVNALENIYLPIIRLRYVDLSKKYWNSREREKLAIGEYEMMVLNSYELSSFNNTGCLFMNLSAAENHGLSVPYDLVNEGKWTFDALAAYRETANHDLDGDGKLTPADSTTFGSYDHRLTTLDFLCAADVPFMGKDEKNLPCFTCFGNEKLINVLEYCKSMFFSAATSVAERADMESMVTTDMFVHDRQLFFTTMIGLMANEEFRSMESVYAVLPIPKYDEAQEEYISRTIGVIFSMVYNNVQDPDMVGAVLEAMNAYAYQNLIPALIETCLQYKYNSDPRNVANIRLCLDTRSVDITDYLVWDIFGDTPLWRQMFVDKPFASWLASVQTKAEKTLDDSLDEIRYMFRQIG